MIKKNKQSKEFLKYKGKIQEIKEKLTEEQKEKRNKKSRQTLIYREVAKKELAKILDNSLNIIENKIKDKEISITELIKVLEHLRDSSGQKPVEKQQIETIEPPKIIVKFNDDEK